MKKISRGELLRNVQIIRVLRDLRPDYFGDKQKEQAV
jgi:hypothetical protein